MLLKHLWQFKHLRLTVFALLSFMLALLWLACMFTSKMLSKPSVSDLLTETLALCWGVLGNLAVLICLLIHKRFSIL